MRGSGRAAQPPRGLVEGEALEVAKNHRLLKGPREARDLLMKRLGLLAGNRRHIGWRVRQCDCGTPTRIEPPPDFTLFPLPSSDSLSRTPRSPRCHAVQPVAQKLRLPDRAGLPSEDQEDGLECILGVLIVAQHLAADAQNHRPVPANQRRECGLSGCVAPASGIPLYELTIGQPEHRAAPKDRLELEDHRR
jgi:hypothetical protein